MDKTLKIYIAIIVIFVGLLVAIESSKPKEIDWTPTYGTQDKIPFGLYIFNEEIRDLLPKNKLVKVEKTPYEFFNYDEYQLKIDSLNYSEYSENDVYSEDIDTVVETSDSIVLDTVNTVGNYVAPPITESIDTTYTYTGGLLYIDQFFQMDKESVKEILKFVAHGNKAVICASNFDTKFLDTLKLKVKSDLDVFKSPKVWFANKNLGNKTYTLDKGAMTTYFSGCDLNTTKIISYQQSGDKKVVNAVAVNFGKGTFILCSQPVLFTNYTLLKNNNKEYSEKLLSYLPKGDLYWLVKGQNGDLESEGMLRFIFSQDSLKTAWFIFLFGLVLFIIFNARRKQRIVPIIKPLSNTTVDFTKTIGNLYYQENNPQNIIDKKIIYFLERIRSEYHIDTTKLDENFINKLQQKTGKNIDDIREAVKLINYQKTTYHQSIESDLVTLNDAIEKIIN